MPTRIATPITEPFLDDHRARPPRERPGIALIGRILLASIFLLSGVLKFVSPTETVAHMHAAGIPYTEALRIIAGVAEILGALSLLFGVHARTGAAGLILFLIPSTIFFHSFWLMEGTQAQQQLVNFMKNLTIMGGLAMVVAMGPGRYSLEARGAARQP